MWPFETSKAITAAILVLNHYPTVDTLDGQKFWRLLWHYTATHTPAWRVMDGVGNNGRKGTGTAADDTASLPPVRSQDTPLPCRRFLPEPFRCKADRAVAGARLGFGRVLDRRERMRRRQHHDGRWSDPGAGLDG